MNTVYQIPRQNRVKGWQDTHNNNRPKYSLNIPKVKSEAVNQRTDNSMTKRKTMRYMYKSPHSKLTIEQHKPYNKLADPEGYCTQNKINKYLVQFGSKQFSERNRTGFNNLMAGWNMSHIMGNLYFLWPLNIIIKQSVMHYGYDFPHQLISVFWGKTLIIPNA